MSKSLVALLFVVTVDSLGLSSPGIPTSMAKRGEIVSEEHLGGPESVQRLMDIGAIAPYAQPEEASDAAPGSPEVPVVNAEPEGPAARFAAGLTLPEDFEWSPEARGYVQELKEGIIPIPFDKDRISDMTVKDLVKRIEEVTGQPYSQGSKKKPEIVDDLEEAMTEYVGGLLEDETEEEGAASNGGVLPEGLPEGWSVQEGEGGWEVIHTTGEDREIVEGGLDTEDNALLRAKALSAEDGG